MMRFNVNGRYLDLYNDTELTFARKNILFAFDDIEVSRTAEFDVPATPQNNAIFERANDPALYGTKGRVKIEAQLQYDGGVEDGYIYITACSRDKYSCMFVFGELVTLQEIRDLKIKDYAPALSTSVRDGFKNANLSSVTLFDTIAYRNGYDRAPIREYMSDEAAYITTTFGAYPLPSYNLLLLIAHACTQNSIVFDYSAATSEAKKVRIKVAAPATRKETDEFDVRVHGNSTSLTGSTDSPYITTDTATAVYYRSGSTNGWSLTCIHTRYTGVKIQIAEDTPDTLFMIDISSYIANPQADFVFYGDYSCGKSGVITGTPLAGREIEVERGKLLAFATSEMIVRGASEWGLAPLMPSGVDVDMSCTIVAAAEFAASGDTVFLRDQLKEDMTIIEMLKYAAVITGNLLFWNEAQQTISLVSGVNYNNIQTLGDIISLDDVRRGFLSFAQANIITLIPNSSSEQSEITLYSIINASIEERNTLYDMPYSQGVEVNAYPIEENTKDVLCVDYSETGEYIAKAPTLILAGDNIYAEPYKITGNNTISQLCSKGTAIKVSVVMSLAAFTAIKERQVLQLRGQYYVWTKAQWSQGVATFELNKI